MGLTVTINIPNASVEAPTVTVVIHRAFTPNGANGWGTALYRAYEDSIKKGINSSVRIVSAPSTSMPNIGTSNRIFYEAVDCDPELFPNAKATAIDVHFWDAMHLISPTDQEPFVISGITSESEQYIDSWKSFFEYSIHTARRSLQLAQDDYNPIFHLNDPHDCFVSALFEGNYDSSWLASNLQLQAELDRFELAKSRFVAKHGPIKHMRFWHTPCLDVEVWKKWYEKDPNTARHVVAGIFSSPLIVHSPQWEMGFKDLADAAIPIIAQHLEVGDRSKIFKGIGVGPIGYERGAFTNRFTRYDAKGELHRVPEVLHQWSSQIKEAVGQKDPIIFFLTCRGDDPKNNLPQSLKALHEFAATNPDAKERMAVVMVYSTSRAEEHEMYRDTLRDLEFQRQQLVDLLGESRVIEGLTLNNDLTFQTAGFLLANSFLCGARGGFDIVGIEASIAAALREADQIDPIYQSILTQNGITKDFQLVLSQSAGAGEYLHKLTPNVSMIMTPEYRIPTAEELIPAIEHAWTQLSTLRAKLMDPSKFLERIDKLCSGSECIEQWSSASIEGNPQNHPRTQACKLILEGTLQIPVASSIVSTKQSLGD